MKYFIAYPFSKIIDADTGLVNYWDSCFLAHMRDILLKKNYDVFLAHFRENWGKDLMADKECTVDDYKEMTESDVVIAFPGNPVSGGVHIELGWASSLKKKIYIFLEEGAYYSPLITGLGEITDVTYFYYDTQANLEKIVDQLIERGICYV